MVGFISPSKTIKVNNIKILTKLKQIKFVWHKHLEISEKPP